MKAVIYNSGLGSRMGALTEHNHKSMVRLDNGETIFTRQLRLLMECGVRDIIVTVGPMKEQLMEAASAPIFSGCNFTFVENPIYQQTNYIYSLYLAREAVRGDDVILLHGDLVFNRGLLEAVLADPRGCLATFNPTLPQPEKDFKVRVKDGFLSEVSVKIFDEDCFAFQPLYKLTSAAMGRWLDAVEAEISAGNDKVYAENAANPIFRELEISLYSYENDFIDEIDTPADYDRVRAAIRPFDYREQRVVCPEEPVEFLLDLLDGWEIKKPFFVVDSAFPYLFWSKAGLEGVFFDEFSPNPVYEDVCKGVAKLKESGCDGIVSIGGGSAIDTAKAIRMFAGMEEPAEGKTYLDMTPAYPNLRHIAIPTTAGTGSESTRFSVIYYQGEKQSLAGDSLLPDLALLAPAALQTLPDRQKKATLMDAVCQCIESLWSVNANAESRGYAMKGLKLLLSHMGGYLDGEPESAAPISLGANLGGKAINITQTTAAHAMSYKITSLYKVPHGQAVALCLPGCWRLLWERQAETTLPGGPEALGKVFGDIASLFGMSDGGAALSAFEALYASLELEDPRLDSEESMELLIHSVNPVRLKNFPLPLTEKDFEDLYREILA